jgi:hypothetical protein
MRQPPWWFPLITAWAAVGIALAALLTVATRSPPPPDNRICGLLGAIMDDSDTTAGLPARAARLYLEDSCK